MDRGQTRPSGRPNGKCSFRSWPSSRSFACPTTVEAAAVTATYALIVATVIHRDLHPFRDLPRVMTECGLLVGGVLLILGVALGFTHYLVDAQIPDRMVEWATHASVPNGSSCSG